MINLQQFSICHSIRRSQADFRPSQNTRYPQGQPERELGRCLYCPSNKHSERHHLILSALLETSYEATRTRRGTTVGTHRSATPGQITGPLQPVRRGRVSGTHRHLPQAGAQAIGYVLQDQQATGCAALRVRPAAGVASTPHPQDCRRQASPVAAGCSRPKNVHRGLSSLSYHLCAKFVELLEGLKLRLAANGTEQHIEGNKQEVLRRYHGMVESGEFDAAELVQAMTGFRRRSGQQIQPGRLIEAKDRSQSTKPMQPVANEQPVQDPARSSFLMSTQILSLK